MVHSATVDEFLQLSDPLLDVRSPAEFEHAHIPSALSFPLFNNDERAAVGTCYKQQGRDEAVELGLKFVGPKLADFVAQAKAIAPDRVLRTHCWRGGMRSGSMAWLLETAGFRVTTLTGGYKAFRQWVRQTLAAPKPIISLGGMTGTGKTAILEALARQGEQVLDLEGIAHHRGSSYGSVGLPPQPSTEQFENVVAIAWAALDARRPIWVEAESRQIGRCRIPDELFGPMVQAPMVQVMRSRPERVANLLDDYGGANGDELVAATQRLQKRLGGLRTKDAIAHIQAGELAPAIEMVLDYYDKAYTYDLKKKRDVPIYPVDITGLSPDQAAQAVQQTLQQVIEVTSTKSAIASSRT
ncbi:MAG: tRNA 2-selenouridine(34) synthase MnmH [Merismopedia sp. SIO2A8]|nr:tRNA 2-selenouridine(34) synthase MnmH [Merismopedia sp. SIO2A8]